MKRNWAKIIILLVAIAVTAGAVTPLFGNVITDLFYLPTKTVAWNAPEGNISVALEHSSAIPTERGKPHYVRELGSSILLGSVMLIIARWGRRKYGR